MKKILTFFLSLSILILVSCDTKSSQTGERAQTNGECFLASDERAYQEMTGYLVLKDDQKLEQMLKKRKVSKLSSNKKVKILKKKIDIAYIEYNSPHGRKKGWIALRNLR